MDYRASCFMSGGLHHHAAGVPGREIGEHVGQTDIATTANTYSLVLTDTDELDYTALLTD